MPNDVNTGIIEEFRANGGRVGGRFANSRLLLLTATGARTGRPHTTPLGYLPDGGRRLVIGSAAGSDKHPDWYLNLVAHPAVTVEDGVFTYDAVAAVLTGEERDDVLARAVAADPGWADHQANTGRVLPVVALNEVPGPPRTAATSFGDALRLIHDAFRRELALIRTEVAASGPAVGAQLRVNCLTLCGGLHGHHVREDEGMFPGIRAQRPDLGPVLDELAREHVAIAGLLERLEAVLARPDTDREHLRSAVDSLTAQVEQHLDREEAALIPALNGTG